MSSSDTTTIREGDRSTAFDPSDGTNTGSTSPSGDAAQVYRPRRHFPPLDGLRGVAILMVIADHVHIWNAKALFDQNMVQFLNFGIHGVDLFFVLSGFLITGILMDSKGSHGYFQTFYIRRTLRIFPLYYLYLGLRLVLIPVLAQHFDATPSPALAPQSHGAFFWLYGSNLLSLFYPDAVIEGGLFHLWSLAVEEQFYLFWPLMVFLLPVRALSGVCVAMMVLAFASRVWLCHIGLEPLARDLTVCRLDALAAGALIAIAVRQALSPLGLRQWGYIVASLSAACIAARMLMHGWPPHETWTTIYGTELAILLSVGVLLLVISGRATLQRLCDRPILRQVGKYSYSMYVFHFMVFRLLAAPMARVHWPLLWGSRVFEQVFTFVVVASGTFLVAQVSWYTYEVWFLRLKDRIPYHNSSGKTATTRPILSPLSIGTTTSIEPDQ